jgi:phosphatidylserine decarboxylase
MAFAMRRQTLAEARVIFVVLAVLLLAGWFISGWLALVFLVLIGYTFAFFRDPDRIVPPDPSVVVAAADGVVADIVEVDETDIVKDRMRRVGIFLSIFDVHTNRAPVDGRIIYREHREGLCLDARSADCSSKNESMTWGFQNARATIVVKQLTGAIARRIVAWSKVGDELKKGDRFGMIRFGSRTEIYLPLSASIVVSIGDRVRGGSSIIARFPNE